MIKFVCKHCGHQLANFDSNQHTQESLGLQSLTHEERDSIITFESNGDLVANVICDYCEEAMVRNPELSLLSNPLQ